MLASAGENPSHSTVQRRWMRGSVSPSTSSSWYCCFSQQFIPLLPLSPRVSSDSSSSFRPCISIISFQHSHCIPITTFPCHAVAKSLVPSCLMFPSGQLCFPAVTDPSSPKCLSISSMQRCFPSQLSQFIPRNNPSLQFLQKNRSPPWSWCLYILTMLFLTVLLCSECFPPHCSCKCGPSCNDAALRKTPFSCDLRQPLELIPGKPFLAFLSYAFLWTDGQSDGWRGEERNNDWDGVVQWLGAHLKFRKIVNPVHFPVLCCCLHCNSRSRVDILFSLLLPFPTAKQLHCSALGSCSLWDYWVQFQWSPQLKDTVQCWAPITSNSKPVHSCSVAPGPCTSWGTLSSSQVSSQILQLNFFCEFSLPWKKYMAPTFGDTRGAGEIKVTPCLEDLEV